MKINEIFGFNKDYDPRKSTKLTGAVKGITEYWNKIVNVNNLDLKSSDPAQQQQNKKHLQSITLQYMSGGEYGAEKTAVLNAVSQIPVPEQLDPKSLNDYFVNTAKARYDILQTAKYKLPDTSAPEPEQTPAGAGAFDQMAKGLTSTPAKPAQPAAPAAAPTQAPQPAAKGPLEGTGVTVIQSFPLVLRYKKHDFQLTDDNQWVDVFRGNPVNPTLANFLQAQANKL